MLKITRLILMFPFLVLVFSYGIAVGMIRPFHRNNIYSTSRFLKYGLTLLGVHFELEGKEYLEIESPAIVISNHQNNFDVLMAAQVLRPAIVSLGKSSIIFIPFFGLFYWLSGNILIKRENRSKAMQSMLKVKDTLIEKSLKVWILPEGTRSWGRGLLPFKKGAFFMAIDAGVPIIPICFSTYHGKINLNKWKSAVVKTRILPPIPTQGLDRSNVKELLEKCHALMSETIQELDKEVASFSKETSFVPMGLIDNS